jgi:PAS domain S-box-containing protein
MSPPDLVERRREDLRQRVQWLLFFRLAVALVGLVLVLVQRGATPVFAPYAVLVAACALDLVYLLVAGRVADQARFAAWQIAIDGALVTVLVYLTGGVYSFAAILYFGSIFAASLCVSARMSVLFASAATCALAAIQLLYHLATLYAFDLPFVAPETVAEVRVRIARDFAYLIAQGLALHLVATLSAWLAQELRRVKILYGEILEKMAEGLVAIDSEGRIVFVNGEARRLLHYRGARSLVGLDFREVFRRREDRAVLDSLLSTNPVTAEIQVETRDGERKAVEVKTSILRDERGVSRGTIGIFTDLTPKKQMEAAEKRAERLEGIEALALGIAHEVRNPLASIRGCVQELGRLEYLGEDERQLAQIVCRESDRLDAIIAEFLRFARLRPPELGEIDLAALLREVAVLLNARVEGGRVSIELALPESARVKGDAPMLTQVFLNLGINAIEAVEGKGALSISCRETRCPRRATGEGGGRRTLEEVPGFEVAFEDTGAGIAPQDLARVFTPFFTTKTTGTGLGLPIAERIVKSHGGTISLVSEPGRGTTVKVLLPAEPQLAAVGAAW